jgi:tetratricopeptide (TPR) repeat protein
MIPATKINKFSAHTNRVRGQAPLSGPTRTATDHGQPVVREHAPASNRAFPPLTLEKESTRQDRVAKAREKQSQDDTSGEVWSSVWSTSRNDDEPTERSQPQSGKSKVPHLALAPEPARTTDALFPRDVRLETCTDLSRSTLARAKKADTEGDCHTALRHYAAAIKNGSNDPQVYFRMGVLLRQTNGDARQSLAHLRKATLLSPEQIKYRCELAELYETLGFPINARRERERIRALQDESDSSRSRRFW